MPDDAVMPADFRYRDVYERGYPLHPWNDRFRLRHPAMDPGHRARIFSPFDALQGFSDQVSAKETVYVPRSVPDPEQQEELNRRLMLLRSLTRNSRLARENRIAVSVTRFVPCGDRDSEAYGRLGQYVTAEGTVLGVTPDRLLLGDTAVPLDDILSVESAHPVTDPLTGETRGIFDPSFAD